jgi:hypothetical protein
MAPRVSNPRGVKYSTTLIKNKRKFSSDIRKIQKGAVAKSYITHALLKYD